MGKKLTYQEVKDFIEGSEGNGCRLLSTEYVNNSTKLQIQCKCGEVFEARFGDFRSDGKRQCNKCGVKIRSKARENRISFNCEVCGKEKTVKKSQYERNKHHFCSKECRDKWQSINLVGSNNPNFGNGEKISGANNYWFGKKFPDELKKKLSIARKGKQLGSDNPNYRKRYVIKCDWCGGDLEPMTKSEINAWEHHFCKDKDCYAKWISENKSGKNHPNYNPNLTEEDRLDRRLLSEYSNWRKDVYKRDDYTCQCCGKKGNTLNAHHLNSYNSDKEHRTNKLNGITLCEKCHREFHSIYGRGNNTIEQFREFLYNKYLQTKDLKYLATLEDIDIRKYVILTNNLSLPI